MKKNYFRKTFGALALAGVLLLSSCANDNSRQVNTSSPDTGKGGSGSSAKTEGIDYNGLLNKLAENKSPSFTSFETITLDGKKVDQSIWNGKKLTMVNIWATFCSPCISEMPELGTLSKEYTQQGVQVVGIVIDVLTSQGISDSQIDLAKDIVTQTNADYLHLLPSNDLIAAKLANVSSVPETIFLDENGNQVGDAYLGARSGEDWRKVIDGLLKEVP